MHRSFLFRRLDDFITAWKRKRRGKNRHEIDATAVQCSAHDTRGEGRRFSVVKYGKIQRTELRCNFIFTSRSIVSRVHVPMLLWTMAKVKNTCRWHSPVLPFATHIYYFIFVVSFISRSPYFVASLPLRIRCCCWCWSMPLARFFFLDSARTE